MSKPHEPRAVLGPEMELLIRFFEGFCLEYSTISRRLDSKLATLRWEDPAGTRILAIQWDKSDVSTEELLNAVRYEVEDNVSERGRQARGGALSKFIKGPRIRGHAFQLADGLWTYFIRLGEGESEKTFHCDDRRWKTREEALDALKAHVNHTLKETGAIGVYEGGKK